MTRIEHIVQMSRREADHMSLMEAIAIRAAVLAMSEALKADPNLLNLEGRLGTAVIIEIHKLATHSKE